jgi:hypothetical protein
MPIGLDAGDGGGGRGGLSPADLAAVVRGQEIAGGEVMTRWRTAEDERVCPECGPLDGQVWPEGEGPIPPLHNHCRCTREFAFIAWSTGR